MSRTSKRSKPPHKRLTLVLGLEHFVDKVGYHKSALDMLGEETLYLIDDLSGMSAALAEKYNANILIVTKNPLKRIYCSAREMFRRHPDFVEIYHTGILSAVYAFLGNAFGARTLLVLRGQEFAEPNDFKARLKAIARDAALRQVDRIIAKESNLENEVHRRGYTCKELWNCVPIPRTPPPIANRPTDILYLNSVRPERHTLDLIQAAEILYEEGLCFNVSLVGFSLLGPGHNAFARDYEKECLAAISASDYSDRFTVLGFSDVPATHLERAKVFVFPADIVFANYALLEAMSYGCVPIIYPGEGHARIVSHASNGLVCSATPRSLAATLRHALTDQARLQALSRNARITITRHFSLQPWAAKYAAARS